MASTSGTTPFPTSDTRSDAGLGSSTTGTTTAGGSTGTYGSSASTDDTIARVKQGAHDAVDRLAERAGPAVERMRSSMNQMSESARAKAAQFGEMEEQWVENARSTVREHPIASVAVAVAAGVILSKLLSSR